MPKATPTQSPVRVRDSDHEFGPKRQRVAGFPGVTEPLARQLGNRAPVEARPIENVLHRGIVAREFLPPP